MAAMEIAAVFKLSNIKIPEKPRREMGNLEGLANSMKELGQLQNIVLSKDLDIIAGERRCRAALLLGWTTIRGFVAENLDDAVKKLKANRDENSERLKPTNSEKVAIAEQIAALLRPKAEESKASSQFGSIRGGDKPKPKDEPDVDANEQDDEDKADESADETTDAASENIGRVDKAAASAADMGRRQFMMGREITHAAKADPKRYGDLVKMMDESGVEKAHREFKKRKAEPTTKADQLLDSLGNEVPSHLRDLFGDRMLTDCVQTVDEWLSGFLKLKNIIKAKADALRWLSRENDDKKKELHVLLALANANAELAIVRGHLVGCQPHAVCPVCAGKRCKECRHTGVVPQWRYQELKKQGAF